MTTLNQIQAVAAAHFEASGEDEAKGARWAAIYLIACEVSALDRIATACERITGVEVQDDAVIGEALRMMDEVT